MIDLPPMLEAGPADRAEADAVVARISGPTSVAVALASDLALGIGRRPVLVTASGDIGRLARQHWEMVIGTAGVVVHEVGGNPPDDVARIHLHGGVAGAAGYSRGGHNILDESAAPLPGDLVGEIMAQGTSPAARYASLVAIAEALADRLRPATSS